jgi:hypothetical protein
MPEKNWPSWSGGLRKAASLETCGCLIHGRPAALALRNPTTGIAVCCVRAASGKAAAAPPQSKSEQLRIRAHECEIKAEAAHDADIRWLYRDMAAQWRQMARQRDELGLYGRVAVEPSRYY